MLSLWNQGITRCSAGYLLASSSGIAILNSCNNVYYIYIYTYKYICHVLHQMGVLFNPRQRNMKVLSESQTIETLEHVRILLTTLPEVERPETVKEPRAKKQRTAFDEFGDDDDNSVEVAGRGGAGRGGAGRGGAGRGGAGRGGAGRGGAGRGGAGRGGAGRGGAGRGGAGRGGAGRGGQRAAGSDFQPARGLNI